MQIQSPAPFFLKLWRKWSKKQHIWTETWRKWASAVCSGGWWHLQRPRFSACPHSAAAVGALTGRESQPEQQRNNCINLVYSSTSADSLFILNYSFVTSPISPIVANKSAESLTRGLKLNFFIFGGEVLFRCLLSELVLIGVHPCFWGEGHTNVPRACLTPTLSLTVECCWLQPSSKQESPSCSAFSGAPGFPSDGHPFKALNPHWINYAYANIHWGRISIFIFLALFLFLLPFLPAFLIFLSVVAPGGFLCKFNLH